MADLQAWFAPLLWVLATITAIVAFVRLCKPVWRIFSAPDKFSKELEGVSDKLGAQLGDAIERFDGRLAALDKRLDEHTHVFAEFEDRSNKQFETFEERFDVNDAVQLSLLHDAIAQIYQRNKEQRAISDGDFRRMEDLYAQDGENPYIDSLVREMREWHQENPIP